MKTKKIGPRKEGFSNENKSLEICKIADVSRVFTAFPDI